MTSRKYNELLTVLKVSRAVANDIGGVLKEIKEGELYKTEIGAGVDTWHQFLSMPEVGLTVNEANQLIKIYELPIHESEKPFISLRNLKFLIGKEVSDELIEDAKVLSHQDLKERHYSVLKSTEDRTYEYVLMRRIKETGSLSRIPGVESEQLKEIFKEQIYE